MKITHMIFFLFLLLLGACTGTPQNPIQGGTEWGNPTSVISGSLQPPQAPSGTTMVQAAPCGADALVAVNPQGQAVSGSLSSDCHFSITLSSQFAYILHFELGGKVIADLVSNPGEAFPHYSFFLSAANKTIDLGPVQLQGSLAIPTNSPLSQMDRDGDGLADSTDPDDDNDGILDGDEKDCDHDGFFDDDDTVSSCAPLGAFKPVLSVSPFNGQTGISHTQKVQIRFGCSVNQGLFAISDLVVKPTLGGPVILCNLSFSADFKTVTCEHGATPFTAGTAYQGLLSEIECQDGTKTQSTTWSWTTAP